VLLVRLAWLHRLDLCLLLVLVLVLGLEQPLRLGQELVAGVLLAGQVF
jgi:hypothetical protein